MPPEIEELLDELNEVDRQMDETPLGLFVTSDAEVLGRRYRRIEAEIHELGYEIYSDPDDYNGHLKARPL